MKKIDILIGVMWIFVAGMDVYQYFDYRSLVLSGAAVIILIMLYSRSLLENAYNRLVND